ncbi:MAG: hypothetical protein WCW14_01990 [Candidatus Paceibacterota bacterium]|jgi:hypothetical protein
MQLKPHHFPIIRVTIAIIIAVVILVCFFNWKRDYEQKPEIVITASRVGDVTLRVGDNDIDFINGVANEVYPDKIDAQFFGEPIVGDINGDKVSDGVIWFSYTSESKETSYYVAGVILTPDGYVGTNAILLGNNLASQTLEVHDGIIIANYAIKRDGDSSVGISKYFKVENGTLVEYVN